MLGTLGVQEMIFIFLLALVLFGPKKLPELGRTLGKAISEFRRAQSELKATFDREMQNLERDVQEQKEIGSSSYRYDSYNYDYSSSEAGIYGEPYGSSATEPQDSSAANTSTISASATQGAEYLSPVTPEGAIAHSDSNATETAVIPQESAAGNGEPESWSLEKELEAQHSANGAPATEHKA